MNDLQQRQQEFMELLRPIQRKLEQFCLNMTRDRDEARDLLQDTIVILWQHLDSIRDKAAFRSYAYTVAANTFKRKFTRSRYFGILTEEHHENLASTDHSPEQLTDHALLRDALHTLSVRSREALILYEIADLSISEISPDSPRRGRALQRESRQTFRTGTKVSLPCFEGRFLSTLRYPWGTGRNSLSPSHLLRRGRRTVRMETKEERG